MELAFEYKDKDKLLRILDVREPESDLEYDDAIHRACEHGWIDVVDVLLHKFRINPDVSDFWKTEIRPIHAAAGAGEVDTVVYLVENGARVDSTDVKGNTALHIAMSKSKWKVVETLINELNADILRSNLEGSVPFLIGLRRALNDDNESAFHLILSLYETTPLPYTVPYDILHSAFEKNWMDELIYLLQIDQGKLERLQSTQHTPLILTVTENGDKELMVLFLKQDISIMSTDGLGNTILLVALKNGHWECAEHIVQIAPTLVTISNENKEGAVRFAARKGKMDMIRLLVENGADPDEEDRYGNTPLLYAIRYDHKETVEYLVKDLHCDLGHLNSHGDSPLSIELISSIYQSNTECALWLLKLNESCQPDSASISKDALLLAYQKNLTPVVNALLQIYMNDPLKHEGLMPLHLAIKNKSFEVIKSLLAYRPFSLHPQPRKSSQIHVYEDVEVQELLELSEHESICFARKAVKIFILGDQFIGKSSLAHSIKANGKGKVKPRRSKPTLCMKVRNITLQEAGSVIIYDCSGNPCYRTCQSSIIKTLIKSSVALFVIVADVHIKDKGKVAESIKYWGQYISELCSGSTGPFHVITVGSFADKSQMNPWGFQNCFWKNDNNSTNGSVIDGGGVMLDCRKMSSQGMTDLLSIVALNCSALRSHPTIASLQFEHLSLYAYLTDKRTETVLSYPELLRDVSNEKSYPALPVSANAFKESMDILSNKGLVVLLEDENDIDSSWVVLTPHVVFSDVPHMLFQSRHCNSINGVIQEAQFAQLFPQYDPKLINLFLCNYSLCLYFANQSTLFCPSLLSGHRDHHSISSVDLSQLMSVPNDGYHFGWCLQMEATEQSEKFTEYFFNLLHLELARMFVKDPAEIKYPLSTYVWSSGFFHSDNEVQFTVELSEDHQCIGVYMSCLNEKKVELVQLRSKLIQLVRATKRKFYSYQKISEYILAPVEYTVNAKPSTMVRYDTMAVMQSILSGSDSVGEDPNRISIEKLLYFEPCQQLWLSSAEDGKFQCQIDCSETSDSDTISAAFSKLPNDVVSAVMELIDTSTKQPNSTSQVIGILLNQFSIFADIMKVRLKKINVLF